ncbi:hypothetical protein I6F20_36820 [Bradyrhizobium sp. IC3123]|nr:hypothetical protein [Bradyrhizobium sp. IC3123]
MVSTRQTMKHDETSGILLKLSALGLTITLLALPAPADARSPSTAQARQWCFANDGGGSDDRRFAGCSALLKANTDDVHALANRGEMFRRRGEPERAVALALDDYDRSIRANANRADVFNSRCFTRAIVGGLQEALADCEQSLKMAPNDAYTLDSRALAHLKLGNLDAAIADYDAALSIKPGLDGSLYGRGLAKRKKGDSEGAERDIAAAKAINAGIADVFSHYSVE